MPSIIHVILTFPAQDEDIITGFLALTHPSGWQTLAQPSPEQCQFEVCFESRLTADAFISQCRQNHAQIQLSERISDSKDWSQAWKEFYAPIPIGDHLLVLPDWIQENPEQRIPILIHPQMAFGTGQHPTTFLCLQTIDMLYGEKRLHADMSFLDIGTGSAILAIACAKFGLSGVAFDIDPVAIDNALHNAQLNTVETKIELKADMLDNIPGTFDLVLANILLNPLLGMCEEIVSRVKKDGILVLSGILETQAAQLAAAYEPLLGKTPRIYAHNGWAVVLFA